MNKIILLLLLGCILTCCKNEKETILLNEAVNVTVQQFNHPLYNGNSDKRKTFVNQDSIYLFSLHGMQQKIEILNLSSKSVKNIIYLNKLDDYNKYGLNINDFYIHNIDSIFLYSHYTKQIALINSSGNFKEVINLSNAINAFESDKFSDIDISGFGNFCYNHLKKEFAFKIHSAFNFDNDINYYKKNIIATYNVNTATFTKTIGNYPTTEVYSDPNNFFVNSYELSYIPFYNKQKYYVSFTADHNIYEISSADGSLLNTYNGKSNFLNSNLNLISRSSESQTILNHLIENGKYKKLLYNTHKKQFYRIVTHNQPLKKETSGKLNNMTFGRNFSIIVFNEDMSIKGEYLFENPKYTYFDISTHPKGILINYKDDNDEDKNILEIHSL